MLGFLISLLKKKKNDKLNLFAEGEPRTQLVSAPADHFFVNRNVKFHPRGFASAVPFDLFFFFLQLLLLGMMTSHFVSSVKNFLTETF